MGSNESSSVFNIKIAQQGKVTEENYKYGVKNILYVNASYDHELVRNLRKTDASDELQWSDGASDGAKSESNSRK